MDNELVQAEKALMEVSRELWESRNYREDEAFNIAAFKLTTGERRSQEEIEKIIGDPENPKDSKLYEKFCENFELVAKAGDSLKLMGSLPYCHPSLLPLKEYGDEPTLYNRFSGFVERNRKSIMLGLLALMLTTLFGAYQIPQMKRNQRIEQLKREARLSEEQALSFDNKYGKFAQDNWFTSSYNQTIVDFAKYYALNPDLTEGVFKIYSSFKNSNDFLSFAINKQNSLDFVKKYPDLIRTFNFEYPLELYSKNSTIFDELYRNISKYPNIDNKLISLTSQLFLDLGYTGKVKVLIPEKGEYREEFLTRPTIQAFVNYSVAINQLGLTQHDRRSLFLLGNATQINPSIVDFEPIILRDSKGVTYILQSKNIARDIWMITNLLKEREGIVHQPQKYEWINRMIQQMAWNIFENEYGPSHFDKRTYKPEDEEVWQVILSFHDYMDSLPSRLKRDGIGVIFPYNDSNLLKNYIADKANRTIALFYLADIPAKTFDKVNKKVVSGIEGMKLFIKQLPAEYEGIIKSYFQPNSKTHQEARWYYHQWLGDRFHHGLPYTVGQFIGLSDEDVRYFLNNWDIDRFSEKIEKSNGIDQTLNKSWNKWDLVKFIYGYESYIGAIYGGEAELYSYGLPLAYKAFGIPLAWITAKPIPVGAMGCECAIPIPDSTVKALRENLLSNRILVGYGNSISLNSSLDGLEKDGHEEIYQGLRNLPIYLWKKT